LRPDLIQIALDKKESLIAAVQYIESLCDTHRVIDDRPRTIVKQNAQKPPIGIKPDVQYRSTASENDRSLDDNFGDQLIEIDCTT